MTSLGKRKFWFVVSILVAIFAAPAVSTTKIVIDQGFDPMYWSASRSLLAFLVCLPFMAIYFKTLFNRRAIKYTVSASLLFGVSIIFHTYAIALSSASYVSIVTLLSPVLLVLFSAKTFHEKFSYKMAISLGFTAVGAAILVIFPILEGSVALNASGIATILAVLNCIISTLSYVVMRKGCEKGANVIGQVGLIAFFVMIISIGILMFKGDFSGFSFDGGWSFWLAAAYSGIGIKVVSKIVNNEAYHYLGGSIVASFWYLNNFLAVISPVILLGERIQPYMALGGILIVIGVVILEYHKRNTKKAHHHHSLRHAFSH